MKTKFKCKTTLKIKHVIPRLTFTAFHASDVLCVCAVLIMNDELLQRLAGKRSSVRPLVVPRAADTSDPLNYHSPPAEVEAWLTAKGFSQQ